jgi:hypothetical protein
MIFFLQDSTQIWDKPGKSDTETHKQQSFLQFIQGGTKKKTSYGQKTATRPLLP